MVFHTWPANTVLTTYCSVSVLLHDNDIEYCFIQSYVMVFHTWPVHAVLTTYYSVSSVLLHDNDILEHCFI